MTLKNTFAVSALLICITAAMAPIAHAQEEIVVVETARPLLYLNGGIGIAEQNYMKRAAPDFNLRMIFSEHKDDNFVADVKLHIVDSRGNTVFFLPSAGPMTDLTLPAGTYHVSATYKGLTETHTLRIAGNQAKDLFFHWNKPTQ